MSDQPRKFEILGEQLLYQRLFFKLVEAQLRHEKFDGTMTEPITRLSFERGDAVAAVMHNPQTDTIILTEQFRYPTARKAAGWIYELPAGIIEEGEEPAATMRREATEETGYTLHVLHPIADFFLSPGGSSERIFLFYARLNVDDKTSVGGGVAREHEYIRTVQMPVHQALAMTKQGKFHDAKTLIGLQWLQLNHDNLPK